MSAGEKVVLSSGQTIEIHDDHPRSAVSEPSRSADDGGAMIELLDVKTDLDALDGKQITI